MENKLKLLIFGLLMINSLNAQDPQDLCAAGASGSDPVFVADPSDCTRYLWCKFDRSGSEPVLEGVNYGKCYENRVFFQNKCFLPTATEVEGYCESFPDCPATGTADIVIANPADSCTDFSFCRLGLCGESSSCPEGEIFNRNSGDCTDNADGFIVGCPTASAADTIESNICSDIDESVFVQGDSCKSWTYCHLNKVYQSGTCACGYGAVNGSHKCSKNVPCAENACI